MKLNNVSFGHSIRHSILPLLFLAVFLATIGIGLLNPFIGKSYAYVQSVDMQKNRTILYALRECISDGDKPIFWNDTLKGTDRNNTNMSAVISPAFRSAALNEVPVGYEIDGDNGQAKCNGLSLTKALLFIGESPDWFFGKIYDLKNPENDGDNIVYKRKDKIFLLSNINTLLKKQDAGIGKDEKLRRMAVAFWQCNEEVPSGQTPSRTHATIGGKQYQLKDGKKSDSQISVGYDLETTNGKYRCDTLLKWGDKAEMAAALASNPPTDDEDADSKRSDAEVCDGIGKLSWIVCPIVQAVVTGVNTMDNAINDLLTVDTNPIFGDINNEDSSSNRYYRAWNGFRSFALGLVVIASLVVIISTAFGYEILDAYTIRKVLPRVLIAIVFISLSWNIMEFLITLTNDVGNGVRALIYAPFKGLDGIDFDAGIGLISWGLLGAGLATLGAIGLLSLGLTAFLAVIIAFLVLVLRELIIIFLVIVAPIGIACLILPNTRKGWQLWQNTFTAMLVVFPIISAMIATGRVFSMTVGAQDGIINELISFAAYILPYFLLPFAFRAAGGLMATLAGLANDRSRGAFDRLKNFRGNRMQEMAKRNKDFSRFSGKTPIGRGLNTAIGAVYNPKSMLRGRGGVIAARSSRQKAYGAGYLKDNEIFQANQGDDAFLLAVANRGLAETKMNKALAKSQDMSLTESERKQHEMTAANYHHAINAASQLGYRGQTAAVRSQALTALAKTGYQFEAGEEGYQQLSDTVRNIAGNDEGAYSSLMNEAQYHLKTAGRSDLGGINHGAGQDARSGIRKLTSFQRGQSKPDTYRGGAQAWMGVNTKDASAGKIGQGIGEALASGKVSTNDVLEWQRMMVGDYGSAADANKLEIQKQLEAMQHINIPAGNKISQQEYDTFIQGIQNNLALHERQLRGTYSPSANELDELNK